VELKRLHYHLTALERLGLVVVAGRRARAGRPVKLYRAVGDAFFVTAGATDVSPSDALAAELRAARAGLADRTREGVLYSSSAQGEFRIRPVEESRVGRLPTADCWRVLRLSPAEALRLGAELDACLEGGRRTQPGDHQDLSGPLRLRAPSGRRRCAWREED
jgi:hypothetical protein